MKKVSLLLMSLLALNTMVPALIAADGQSISTTAQEAATDQQLSIGDAQEKPVLVKKKKVINHERNLLSVWEQEDGSKIVVDWDQVSRTGSSLALVMSLCGAEALSGLSFIPKVIANLVMFGKEWGRGETARALEHILAPFSSTFLYFTNKQKDRLTSRRLLWVLSYSLLPITGRAGTLGALVFILQEPYYLISDGSKGMLPMGRYSKEEFDQIYGKEYKIMKKVVAPRA